MAQNRGEGKGGERRFIGTLQVMFYSPFRSTFSILFLIGLFFTTKGQFGVGGRIL